MESSSTGAPTPACAEGLPQPVTCFETPPDGWLGPAFPVAYEGRFTGCPIDVSDFLTALMTRAAGDEPNCNCECNGQNACSGELEYYVASGCDGRPFGTSSLLDGSCHSLPGPMQGLGFFQFAQPCQPNPLFEFPPVTVEGIGLCATDDVAACEGSTCLGGTDRPIACVYRPGTERCPAGYPAQVSGFTSFNDTRSCGDCTCSGGCQLDLHQSADCDDVPFSTLFPDDAPRTCADADTYGFVTRGEPVECTADPIAATGEVTPEDLFAVCCTEAL